MASYPICIVGGIPIIMDSHVWEAAYFDTLATQLAGALTDLVTGTDLVINVTNPSATDSVNYVLFIIAPQIVATIPNLQADVSTPVYGDRNIGHNASASNIAPAYFEFATPPANGTNLIRIPQRTIALPVDTQLAPSGTDTITITDTLSFECDDPDFSYPVSITPGGSWAVYAMGISIP